MNKSEQIKALLQENRATLLDGEEANGICFDGIIDEETYLNQSLKVAVLLKETNSNEHDGSACIQLKDWDYLYWLKHQQADNEPEMRNDKNGKPYKCVNVFYPSTFKKLCHWLAMLFDLHQNVSSSSKKFFVNGSIDIAPIRKVLKNVALINLKKTWGKEKTNATKLKNYATTPKIAEILKKQIDIISPDIVLCCSPTVFWIAGKIYGIDFKENIKRNGKDELFVAEGKVFVKLFHPQWYGKADDILGNQVLETLKWALSFIKQK